MWRDRWRAGGGGLNMTFLFYVRFFEDTLDYNECRIAFRKVKKLHAPQTVSPFLLLFHSRPFVHIWYSWKCIFMSVALDATYDRKFVPWIWSRGYIFMSFYRPFSFVFLQFSNLFFFLFLFDNCFPIWFWTVVVKLKKWKEKIIFETFFYLL